MVENYKKKFYAIIGENPSKGARSPKLWNACFKKFKINSKMIPIDIRRENFKKTFNKLVNDKNYLGGAVAVPYKEEVFKKLNHSLEKKSQLSMAVNCIIRKKTIKAFNTDGEAALMVLKKNKLRKKHKILLLGLGGAGKAVASQLFSYSNKNLYVSGRSIQSKMYANKNKINFIDWKERHDNLYYFDYIINCTSCGFNNKQSPLDKKFLTNITNKVFFDIIYMPKKTELLSIVEKKNKIINGIEMNLFQAVLAFSKISKKYKFNKILNIMKKVK